MQIHDVVFFLDERRKIQVNLKKHFILFLQRFFIYIDVCLFSYLETILIQGYMFVRNATINFFQGIFFTFRIIIIIIIITIIISKSFAAVVVVL